MSKQNTFPGYSKVPGKRLVKGPVRLDFNAQIEVDGDKGAKLNGFYLRLFVPKENAMIGEVPELSVYIRPEEWLDLIESMKDEAKSAFKWRKKMDDLSGPSAEP